MIASHEIKMKFFFLRLRKHWVLFLCTCSQFIMPMRLREIAIGNKLMCLCRQSWCIFWVSTLELISEQTSAKANSTKHTHFINISAIFESYFHSICCKEIDKRIFLMNHRVRCNIDWLLELCCRSREQHYFQVKEF